MVPPASHRVPRVRWYSGSCRFKLLFAYWTLTYFGYASHHILLNNLITSAVLNPHNIAIMSLASFHFARRYFENRFFFLFLRLLRCFSSAGFLHIPIVSVYDAEFLLSAGSPIRKSTDL